MVHEEIQDLPYFYMEMNYQAKKNTIKIVVNELALEHLIDRYAVDLAWDSFYTFSYNKRG